MRAKLFSKIDTAADGKTEIFQKLENGNGRLLSVTENALVKKITREMILKLAEKTGFQKTEFYAGFNRSPVMENSDSIIAVIS